MRSTLEDGVSMPIDSDAGKGSTVFDGSSRLRNNNFDALRLIFASMVVIFHAGLLSQSYALAWTSHISATFAVQSFFVVSGFLVTMSFENSSSIRSYFEKRLRRIAPAYITVVILATICLSAISTLPAHAYFANSATWKYLGFNLILSNFSAPDLPGVFSNNYVTAVNGSLWTIKIEAAFYCIVPFMVLAIRRFSPAAVLAILFTASVLWKIGLDAAGLTFGSELLVKLSKQLPGQLAFFVGGAWAFYRTRSAKGINPAFAALALLAYGLGKNAFLLDLVSPFAVTAIVYWAAICAPKLPAVAKHGDFSYGVYLYHFPLVQCLVAINGFAWSGNAMLLVLAAILAVCAFLSWHLIERPMLLRRTPHA